jgi:hypothetical protein
MAKIDSVVREPGTETPWVTRVLGPLASNYQLIPGLDDDLYLLKSPVDPNAVVYGLSFQRREGECWVSTPDDTLLLPQLSDLMPVRGAVDATGNLHAAFFQTDGLATFPRLYHATRSSGTWSPELVDPTFDASLGVIPFPFAHAVAEDGSPYMAYVEHYGELIPGGQVLWCARKEGSAWVRDAVDTLGQFGPQISLAVDSQGRPHIAYTAISETSAGEIRLPEILHAVRVDGTWTDSVVANHSGTLAAPPCAMALDSWDQAHFLYRGIGGPPTFTSLLYIGPTTPPGSPEVVNDYADVSPGATPFELFIGPGGVPQTIEGSYPMAPTPWKRLLHHRRLTGGGWESSLVDSSVSSYWIYTLGIDPSGRSLAVYNADPYHAGLSLTAKEAVESSSIGETPASGRARENRPGQQFSASEVDNATCTWKRRAKELMVQLGRDPLLTELAEAASGAVDPSLILLSQEDLSNGDALLSARDYTGALTAYQQGFMRILEHNHPEHATTGVPARDLPDRVKLLSIRATGRSGDVQATFFTPVAQHVRLDLFDLMGRRVGTMLERHVAAGAHRIEWTPARSAGSGISAGVYFGRLSAASGTDRSKFVLLR